MTTVISDAIRAKALAGLEPKREEPQPSNQAPETETVTVQVSSEEPTAEAESVDEEIALEVRRQPTSAERAIEAAATAAIEQSGIPGRDEFLQLCLMAKMLSSSQLAPKALRDKPYDMLVILLTGRDLGVPLTAATRLIYVIDGKPSIAPKLLNARLRQLGLGSIRPGRGNDKFGAKALPYGPDGKVLLADDGLPVDPITFTWDDAQDADLVCRDCQPDDHSEGCRAWKAQKDYDDKHNRRRCKDNYLHYAKNMHWWRAAQWCADAYFPEAGMGLYNPDELGAVTDEYGDPIDVNSVEVPEGFERGRGQSNGGPLPDPAEWDDVAELLISARALDEEGQAELVTLCAQKELPRLRDLANGQQVRLASSLIRGIESKAKARGWHQANARAEVLAPMIGSILRASLWANPFHGDPEAPTTAPDSTEEPTEPEQAAEIAPEPQTATQPRWCWCGEQIEGHTIGDHEPGRMLDHPPLCPEDMATADLPEAGMPDGLPASLADALVEFIGRMDDDTVLDCLLERGAEPDEADVMVRRRQLVTLLAREAAGAREGTE